jgi:hypothetical protein
MFDNIIKSLSVLLIFIGCLFLVYNYAKTDVTNKQPVLVIEKPHDVDPNNVPLPSYVFKDMFELPSVWMGRADRDSRMLIDKYKQQIRTRVEREKEDMHKFNNLHNEEVNETLNELLDNNSLNFKKSVSEKITSDIVLKGPKPVNYFD